MKKALYILIVLFLGLVSCANNSDQPDIITPPGPGPGSGSTVPITADDLAGIWETYFFQKDVEVIYENGKTQNYGNLRYTDYDGFRTEYIKGGTFKSYNAIGGQVDTNKGGAGTYEVIDSANVQWIKHYWKTERGNDTIIMQKVIEFGVRPGILKTADIYRAKTSADAGYTLTDSKFNREMTIAPNATDYVNPAKELVDYDELSQGTWELYSVLRYFDNDLDRIYSESETLSQKGTTYKFYTDNGRKMVRWRAHNKDKDIWENFDCPVVVIDDVIHYFFNIEEEDGTITESGSFFWFTDRRERQGYDSFIDKSLDRDSEDVRRTKRLDIYYRRIADK
jgi:hypothetical protein